MKIKDIGRAWGIPGLIKLGISVDCQLNMNNMFRLHMISKLQEIITTLCSAILSDSSLYIVFSSGDSTKEIFKEFVTG